MTKTQDGFRPLTEGYQPGAKIPLQRGYAPNGPDTAGAPPPPKPPRGGSSAAKPAGAGSAAKS